MKIIKALSLLTFSVLFGLFFFEAVINYFDYGFIDSIPYALVAFICLIAAGSINESRI